MLESRDVSVANANAALIPGVHSSRRTAEWWYTSILIVASIVGMGVLAIPGAVKMVGWTGMLLLLLCYPTNLYTGLLLGKLALVFPDSITYGDVAGKLFGRLGKRVTDFSLYFYLFLLMGDCILVAARSVQGFFYNTDVCLPVAAFVSCLLLLPSNQMRTLSNLTFLGAVSTLTITAVLGICLVEAIAPTDGARCRNYKPPAPMAPKYHTSMMMEVTGAISTFILAFSGQKIFLEMASEMKNPAEFGKACHVAFPYLLLIYLLIGGLTYGFCGEDTPNYLTDILPFGWVRRVANVLMFIHIGISYSITQQVLTGAIHRKIDKINARTMLDFSRPLFNGEQNIAWMSQFRWFLISTAFLVLAFVMSSSVPFFEAMVQFIGALMSSSLSFGFPVVLHYFMIRQKSIGAGLNRYEMMAAVALVILNIYVMITGTMGSMIAIKRNWDQYGPPFSCQCAARGDVCDAQSLNIPLSANITIITS